MRRKSHKPNPDTGLWLLPLQESCHRGSIWGRCDLADLSVIVVAALWTGFSYNTVLLPKAMICLRAIALNGQ